MKPLKYTTALTTYAASAFLFVPSAFAEGGSDALQNSISPESTVAIAVFSVAAVAGFVGWGKSKSKCRKIEEEFGRYKVKTKLTTRVAGTPISGSLNSADVHLSGAMFADADSAGGESGSANTGCTSGANNAESTINDAIKMFEALVPDIGAIGNQKDNEAKLYETKAVEVKVDEVRADEPHSLTSSSSVAEVLMAETVDKPDDKHVASFVGVAQTPKMHLKTDAKLAAKQQYVPKHIKSLEKLSTENIEAQVLQTDSPDAARTYANTSENTSVNSAKVFTPKHIRVHVQENQSEQTESLEHSEQNPAHVGNTQAADAQLDMANTTLPKVAKGKLISASDSISDFPYGRLKQSLNSQGDTVNIQYSF